MAAPSRATTPAISQSRIELTSPSAFWSPPQSLAVRSLALPETSTTYTMVASAFPNPTQAVPTTSTSTVPDGDDTTYSVPSAGASTVTSIGLPFGRVELDEDAKAGADTRRNNRTVGMARRFTQEPLFAPTTPAAGPRYITESGQRSRQIDKKLDKSHRAVPEESSHPEQEYDGVIITSSADGVDTSEIEAVPRDDTRVGTEVIPSEWIVPSMTTSSADTVDR